MSAAPVIIVAALVRRQGDVLLVEQQGLWDPEPSWMLPGGRVDPGETLLGALERELAEETGLGLTSAEHIAFVVEIAVAGERSYSAITFDCAAEGVLAPADPDGFVRRAEWLPIDRALGRLRCVAWYECAPLERYLSRDAAPGTVYTFERQ